MVETARGERRVETREDARQMREKLRLWGFLVVVRRSEDSYGD